MELKDIIMDSLIYPSQNIKALLTYIFISIILVIVAIGTGLTSTITGTADLGIGVIVALIGLIICVVLMFLIEGYSLDIIKIAINRENTSPQLDFNRQLFTGIKYFIVSFVYMLIPIIISLLLLVIFQHWIVTIVGIILMIIFGFALSMAECRLAQTDDLGYALDVKGAIDDLNAIGVSKVIITIFAAIIISFIISLVIIGIFSLAGSETLTSIISAIVQVYMLFFTNRVMGLLYSDK